jgi:hypothetical protein
LQAEGEVEEDERIDVECCNHQDIDENPNGNNDGLGDEKARRAKKRANASAFKANQSSPKTDCRCR